MANRFAIQPASGLPGFQALAQGVTSRVQFEREKAAEGEKQAKREESARLFREGSEEEIADFMRTNPTIVAEMNAADNFLNERTQKNAVDTAWDVVKGVKKPSQAYIDRSELVLEEGGDPNRSLALAEMAQDDPELAKKDAMITLLRYDRDAYEAYQKTGTAGEEKPTANIKDWRHYRKLLARDKEQASQFARQVGITETAEPDLKPTVAIQNYDRWQTMTEGAEKTAFGRMIGIDPKDTPGEQRKKAEEVARLETEMDTADETLGFIDKLEQTEGYLDALTGFRGAVPFSVPGGVGFDAMVAFDQLKDSLTLENMGKMTGILSDSDIKILRSAGAGLKPGMSEDAFQKRLKTIRDVIEKKSVRKRERLGSSEPTAPTVASQADYDNLPSGTVFIEDGQRYRKP